MNFAPPPEPREKANGSEGIGSGTGKTGGKRSQGTEARAGRSAAGFEGGQMPMMRRIPKKGFNNARFAKEFQIVNVESLASRFEAGATVGFSEMYAARLVQKDNVPVKVLASGDIDKALTVQAQAFSAQAKAKIEAAGGKAEVI